MLTPYDDKESADQHAHQLEAKEGRALQLPEDADKIESLLTTGSGYRIFLFEMPNEKLKHYPVYTLRGYPNRLDGKHRYEQFDREGLPPLGSDTE